MRIALVFCMLSLACYGCASEAEEKMGGDVSAPWAELDALNGEPLMSVGYPLERGDLAAAKQAVASESFQSAVRQFEQSPLPSGYSDKEAQKAAAVQALNALIEAAKSGTSEDVKAKFSAASQSLAALRQ